MLLNVTAAGLSDLRGGNDANCTYEGDNNVLQQQTSNWLIQLWSKRHHLSERGLFDTPLQSIGFLLRGDGILGSRFQAKSAQDLVDFDSESVVHTYPAYYTSL